MTTYEHSQLVEEIRELGVVPSVSADFDEWLTANRHLNFLARNSQASEQILHGHGPFSYFESVIVPATDLYPIDKADLLRWNCFPLQYVAGYGMSLATDDDLRVIPADHVSDSTTLRTAHRLVFQRYLEGVDDPSTRSFELWQQFAHTLAVTWIPEHDAFCRINEHGDFESVISTTEHDRVSLVTCNRSFLDEYLVATDCVLVILFDFTLYRPERFSGWPHDGEETVVTVDDDLFCRQRVIESYGAYTRGVHVIQPRYTKGEAIASIRRRWSGRQDDDTGVELTIIDWRYDQVREVSTEREATTNYFDAVEGRPFELSPAFFRPEVLLKYTADRDKYTVEDRTIHCRGAWSLRSFGINDAGQVFAYVCYLRSLPIEEQRYWQSFNERPKAGLPEHVIETDFRGRWLEATPPQRLRNALIRWERDEVRWWRAGSEDITRGTVVPRSTSRDEWATTILRTAALVIEGFQVRMVRQYLTEAGITFEPEERSIVLLERACGVHRDSGGSGLTGLREMQMIRNQGYVAHRSSDGGRGLAAEAIGKHGSYAKHFETLCDRVADDLAQIEAALSEEGGRKGQ